MGLWGALLGAWSSDPTCHVVFDALLPTCQVVERRLQRRSDMHETLDERRYVLVIKSRHLALGPFTSLDEAEYAALDYYGTAVTGVSARDELLIAELRAVDPAAISRQQDAHVRALMTRDD